MLIAILHYHLNRGGVTQVIANHLRALDSAAEQGAALRVVILYGGRKIGWPERLEDLRHLDCSLRIVPGLDYDGPAPSSPAELADQLRAALYEAGGTAATTVVHAHNAALGKNASLPAALVELAREGFRLLLQIHDFAEDYRPENYRRLWLSGREDDVQTLQRDIYPQAPQVHYAVLNARDQDILARAGIESARLHLLPNPVSDPGSLPSRETARDELARRFGLPKSGHLLLYPVRGIRRKNLGEALLWAALTRGHGWLGVTLPPLNPAERPAYDRWKQRAASLSLPVVFETGGESGLGYAENLAAADRILTTSVAEGFGMVFLESWLAGRPLLGRDLPEVTGEFVAAGIRLEGLRPQLLIPVAWVGVATFCDALEQAYVETLRGYGRRPPPAHELRRQAEALIRDGLVDFACLTSGLQSQVIEQVVAQPARHREVLARNPGIEAALAADCTDLVRENAAVVRRSYSLPTCGQRLLGLYQAVNHSPPEADIQPLAACAQILDDFLSLKRFHPVRTES